VGSLNNIQSLTKNNCRHIYSLRCYTEHQLNVAGKVRKLVLANQNQESADVQSSKPYKEISVWEGAPVLALIGCILPAMDKPALNAGERPKNRYPS